MVASPQHSKFTRCSGYFIAMLALLLTTSCDSTANQTSIGTEPSSIQTPSLNYTQVTPELPSPLQVTSPAFVDAIPTFDAPYRVSVEAERFVAARLGSTASYSIVIRNDGTEDDSYRVSASSSLGWADLSAVPNVVNLSASQSITFTIVVTVPTNADSSARDRLKVVATNERTTSYSESFTSVEQFVPASTPDN